MRLRQLTGFFRRLPGSTSSSAFIRMTKPYTRLTCWNLEVTHVFRHLALQGVIFGHRPAEAFRDLPDLRTTPYSHHMLLPVSGHCVTIPRPMMAAYIVLAEKLGAALVTRDGRLASASGHAVAIELF
jgi:hypothetical protein